MAAATVILTAKGRAAIAKAVAGTPLHAYVGWGTGTGSQTDTMPDLFAPAAEARALCAQSLATTTTTQDTAIPSGALLALTSQHITEAGLFSAVTLGDLWAHVLLNDSALDAVAGDAYSLNWPLQVVDA